VRKAEAEEIREQLLELLDERHEAGPTDYVVQRATVEPDPTAADSDEWCLVLVFRPTVTAPLHGWRQRELRRIRTGEEATPEAMAWDVYGTVLEAGGHPDDVPEGDDGVRWLTG
jgi:hypothetical protein